MIKRAIIILILILAAGAGITWLFALSAKQVEIVSADISTVKDLSLSGLTIEGSVKIYNGGFMPVIVDRITYTVTVQNVKGVVGKGNITGHAILPKESGVFPVSIRLEWVPSIETAIELITSNSTYAEIKGIAHIAELKGFIKLELPFTAKVNLKGYVEQFTPTLPYLVPEGITSEIVDIIGGAIGAFAEGVSRAIY